MRLVAPSAKCGMPQEGQEEGSAAISAWKGETRRRGRAEMVAPAWAATRESSGLAMAPPLQSVGRWSRKAVSEVRLLAPGKALGRSVAEMWQSLRMIVCWWLAARRMAGRMWLGIMLRWRWTMADCIW